MPVEAASLPPLTGELERVRYAAFRDLWRRGFFLTAGDKFGGDFLAYPGDPGAFRAQTAG